MSTETTTTRTQSPARAFLRAASAQLKPLAQEAGKSVNELLTDIYSNRAREESLSLQACRSKRQERRAGEPPCEDRLQSER